MSIKYYDKSGESPQEKLLAGISPVDAILSGTSKNAIQNKAVYNALRDKIDKTVNDLLYYYSKTDVYNKAEVRELIGAIDTLTMEVVSSLPVSDISTTTIYLLKQSGSNVYDEYVYISDAWVKIGTTEMDLSGYLTVANFNIAIADYYTKAEIDAFIDNFYTKAEIDADFYDKVDMDELLDAKQDALTFDSVPTEGSTNPVQSGGTFNAIKAVSDDVDDISDEIADMNNVLGAKNIVPNVAKTQTVNGITYTANSDGSITINGTATGWAQSYVIQGLLHKGTYKISIGTALPTKVWATLRNVDSSSSILNLGNGSSTVEKSFTLSSDTNVGLFCGIEGGITVNNLTVYPMIRPASITDDTYVPYSRTNQELTGEVEPMLNVLGAKNLLPNNAVSKTVNGITFTVNSDGSIGISSTNSETNGSYSVSDEFLLKKGSYKLSRGKHSTPCPSLYVAKASDFSLIAELTTDSGTEEISFTLDADVKVKCWMWYIANNAYNTTFYPMIRPASIQDDTYVPYAMTNSELTERKKASLSTTDFPKLYRTAYLFMRNGVVQLELNGFVNLSQGENTAVITLPQEFRPDSVRRMVATAPGTTEHYRLSLYPSGNVDVYCYSTSASSTNIAFDMIYIK